MRPQLLTCVPSLTTRPRAHHAPDAPHTPSKSTTPPAHHAPRTHHASRAHHAPRPARCPQAAVALSKMTTDEELARDSVFPSVGAIREVSLNVAIACARDAYDNNLARANPARGALPRDTDSAVLATFSYVTDSAAAATLCAPGPALLTACEQH